MCKVQSLDPKKVRHLGQLIVVVNKRCQTLLAKSARTANCTGEHRQTSVKQICKQRIQRISLCVWVLASGRSRLFRLEHFEFTKYRTRSWWCQKTFHRADHGEKSAGLHLVPDFEAVLPSTARSVHLVREPALRARSERRQARRTGEEDRPDPPRTE